MATDDAPTDEVDGERVVDGDLLFPLVEAGGGTVIVVGHTGCHAVTTAYRVATGTADADAGPVTIEIGDDGTGDDGTGDDGTGTDRTGRGDQPASDERGPASDGDADLAEADAVNRLVEYVVDRQVAFLRDSGELPAGTRVYGFVYDAGRVYGDVPGRAYLVNCDGETDVDLVADRVPSRYREAVRRVLD